tara:strand:+ start:438 stop:860 length:423 start_codon:yes stop_codon:yes gene_type:complete
LSEQQKTINNFYVLVGSNIEPVENIKKGLSLIEQENKIFLIKQSSEYQSKAFGMEGDDFINKVINCSTDMNFRETLDYLKSVEKRCGRIREENKFIPRTLDLDIIDWNNFEGVIEGYQLPDPEIEKHDFIKKPYIELIRS